MFQTIMPPPQLRKYIDLFWLGDDEDLSFNPNTHHAIATSKMELLFFCRGIYATSNKEGKFQNVFKAGFYGHTTGFEHYYASAKKTTIFGIRLSPIASLTLLAMPANELTNQKIEIKNILGNDGTELTDKIFNAPSFIRKTEIAIDFFSNRIKPLPVKYRSVENALARLQQLKTPSISQLVAASCLSPRQFENHFKELTGFSARTYVKLARFEKVVEAGVLSKIPSENKLIDIAYNLGYYDQAHFNRHFKEFTGLNPNAYFANLY